MPLLTKAQVSPYAGQESQEIKALTTEEIGGFLTGQGMGFAKAAELNHHPGPKHVLDLAKQLTLTKDQIAKTTNIFEQMQDDAIQLGKLIVDNEESIDALFSSPPVDEEELRTLVANIASLQGELRFVHLRAHLEMKKLLSTAQVKKYDELRGYGAKADSKSHQHKHH